MNSEEDPIPARTCKQALFTTVLPFTAHFFKWEPGGWDPSSLFKLSGTCAPQTAELWKETFLVSPRPPWPGHSYLLNGWDSGL